MRRALPWVVIVAVLVLLPYVIARWSQRPGRVLYLGGPVLTMDADNRIADAVLTDGDRIVAVGNEAEVRSSLGGRSVRTVELEGRVLMPGFIDAHGHFPGSGLTAVMVDLNSPPIGSIRTIEEIVAKLRAKAAETTKGEWIVGLGYDDSLLAERRHPTRQDLDRASTDHPIAINHVSGHVGVLNSSGLALEGVDESTPDPDGGRIVRDTSGSATGLLEEEAAQRWIAARLQPSLLDGLRIVRSANATYLAAGVTTAQSGLTPRELISGLSLLSRLGFVDIRLVVWPDEDAGQAIADGDFDPSFDRKWVNLGATKVVADGSIQAYTGYLSEPYHVPPGDDPTYRGYPRIEREDLIGRVKRLHDAGVQIAVHGNGDAAIDDILDAYESAQKSNPRLDARHIIIHSQMAREDQLDRMAQLGVIPSFFVLHTYYWGDRHRDIFMGPERAARMSPTQSALRRGIRFTIHTDTPVVPIEPLRLVWAAVNRQSTGGAVIGAEQRITPMQALRAVTIDAAHQHFEDQEKGSLEPGKLADMVILDRSPLTSPAEIDRIVVDQTIVGGRRLYRRDQ